MWEIDGDAHIGTVLKLLGMELQAGRIVPFKNCGGVFAGTSRPLLPTGGWGREGGGREAKGWLAMPVCCHRWRASTPLTPGSTSEAPTVPPLPSTSTGRLTAAAMCATIAALQPEGAIVVDEALTSGTAYWEASSGCPQFSHLTLTGGAIGAGIPMAVGAAMACPARRVINIQVGSSADAGRREAALGREVLWA